MCSLYNLVGQEMNVKKVRNKSFPYYDDWLIIFGKDRANGKKQRAHQKLPRTWSGKRWTTDIVK